MRFFFNLSFRKKILKYYTSKIKFNAAVDHKRSYTLHTKCYA